jgi:hypothetical protein
MKKKGNLVKRLFVYVFLLSTLTLYTTGCVSYDEDIDDIYKRLEELESRIKAIEDEIASGKYIQDVQSITGGFKVTFKDGKSYEIVTGDKGDKGDKGDPGATWSINSDDDGISWYWYKDGVKEINPVTKEPYQAVGKDGKDGKTAPSPEMFKKNEGEYYWIIFKWDDEKNEFMRDTLDDRKGYEPLYSYNTYIVDRDSYYELNVWVQDPDTPSNSAYKKINLPKESSLTTPFLEFLGYYEHFNIGKPETPISMTTITDDIRFKYWYIEGLSNKTDGGDTSIWVGRKTVEPEQVLTTLEKDSAVAIIRTNLPKASWKLTLKNSQGELLPISFGNPVRHTGPLTKALGNDSIYILQMDGTKDKYPSGIDEYKKKLNTIGNNLGVVYSLTDTVTGINSGYKAFITPEVGTNSPDKATLSTIGGQPPVTGNEYLVEQDKDLEIKFNNDKHLYDYYVEAVDSTQAVDNFGFTVDKPKGTFKVNIPQDPPAEIDFKIIVYKLLYNGDFYKDTVTIKPIIALP